MNNEMKKLYENLESVEIKSIAKAYDYLGNEINSLDMKGLLSYEMTVKSLKTINKEYKLLKKFYKGKAEINPDSVYQKYPEDSGEYFFLKCLIKLMENNLR